MEAPYRCFMCKTEKPADKQRCICGSGVFYRGFVVKPAEPEKTAPKPETNAKNATGDCDCPICVTFDEIMDRMSEDEKRKMNKANDDWNEFQQRVAQKFLQALESPPVCDSCRVTIEPGTAHRCLNKELQAAEQDIKIVMQQTLCSYDEAREALISETFDIANAILKIRSKPEWSSWFFVPKSMDPEVKSEMEKRGFEFGADCYREYDPWKFFTKVRWKINKPA